MSTHRAALTLARCSVAAHSASLRVLATSALRASDGQRPGRECIFTFRTALALRRRGVPCLRTSCARHFSPSGLHLFASICSAKNARNDVHPTIRNGRPAAPEGLQYSLVHWAYDGLIRALRAAFVRPVISDESLVLPILCQCSGKPLHKRYKRFLPPFGRAAAWEQTVPANHLRWRQAIPEESPRPRAQWRAKSGGFLRVRFWNGDFWRAAVPPGRGIPVPEARHGWKWAMEEVCSEQRNA